MKGSLFNILETVVEPSIWGSDPTAIENRVRGMIEYVTKELILIRPRAIRNRGCVPLKRRICQDWPAGEVLGGSLSFRDSGLCRTRQILEGRLGLSKIKAFIEREDFGAARARGRC